MKTIIETETGISKYVFPSNAPITVHATHIETPVFNIMDMNSGNASIVETGSVPADWYGCKYIYNDGWSLNPDFEEQTPPE